MNYIRVDLNKMCDDKEYITGVLMGFFVGYAVACLIGIFSVAGVQGWNETIEITVLCLACLIGEIVLILIVLLIGLLSQYKLVKRE